MARPDTRPSLSLPQNYADFIAARFVLSGGLMASLSTKTSALLSIAAAASIALLACGGASGPSLGALADDGGGVADSSSSAGDGSVPLESPDAGGADAGPSSDAAASCSRPLIPDGGQYLGCARATCPSGTVCVQRDLDVTSVATCVAVPPACSGKPTCACMGTVAQECAEPGTPITDAQAPFLGCHDTEQEDASFLDFPCGCA